MDGHVAARLAVIALVASAGVALSACATAEVGSGQAVGASAAASVPAAGASRTLRPAPPRSSPARTVPPGTPTPRRSPAPAPVTSAAQPPPTWAATFAAVSTGVVRLDSICDASGSISTGTGFLIAPTLVATVAHVVEGAGALRVTSPTSGLVAPGQVIGIDHATDLALVRTPVALPGHIFRLSPQAPAIGTEMAAIGFPLAQSMQLSIGHIQGTHDHRYVGGEFDLSDVLLSDAALNPGNSGGPWITRSGTVIGLDESGPPFLQSDSSSGYPAQGNNGGVSAADALQEFADWQRDPAPQAARGCQPSSAASAAQETLDLHFFQIDQSDYASAYAQLWSQNHPIRGLAGFVDGVQSSTDSAADGSAFYTVLDSGRDGADVYVDVAFRSHQHAAQGQDGETCTDWTLRYEFRAYFGLELIYASPAVPGTPGHRPCA